MERTYYNVVKGDRAKSVVNILKRNKRELEDIRKLGIGAKDA